MKKIFNYTSAILLLFLFVSCEKNLDKLNTNTTSPTAIDPVFQLNTALFNHSFPGATLVYDIGIVQQIVTPNSGVLAGANFNQDNRDVTQQMWQAYYRNVIRNTRDVLNRTKDVPDRSNLYHMTRIFQAYNFMILTDSYGDIPYTQGGGGYTDTIFFPAYNSQQEIYTDIIKELTEASAALNPAGKIEAGEVLYAGDISKWKKFGYSLLLRAGMRLSKVDAAKAEQTVKAAVAGGVILLNADNAILRHDPNYAQPIGNTLNSTEAANFYLTEPFVNYLKSTNDPRLSAIAIRYKGAKSGPEQTVDKGTTAAADQIGMPLGYDNAGMIALAAARGMSSFYEFSQVDRRRMVKLASPVFYVTAAQTQLLLAEARQRNWITTGTVQGYYDAGVTLHMQQMATYDAASTVALADIQAYLAANPFNAATALQQINTQYWIASFLNGPETFANFRRSGFPALTPNPYPGKTISGTFIRRLTYPNSEISVNSANVQAAIARMGPDNMDTKVWWDK